MATTLEVKLRTAALATPALTALLGTVPFRWFDMQLDQGSAMPAVTVFLVSSVPSYTVNARLSTTLSRIQFTIWDTDPERARSVETAIIAFLDTFNAMNTSLTSPRQANRVTNRRQMGNAQTASLSFWRIIDALIYNNEKL